MTDRLTQIIDTLDRLPIRRALEGIDRSLPGWPTGATSGNSSDPDGDIALTKVEAVATTPDPAMRALKDYPRLITTVTHTACTILGFSTPARGTQPDRMVNYTVVVLTEAQKRLQPIGEHDTRKLWNLAMQLRDQTLLWAAAATPTQPHANNRLGIEDRTPRWCTSCQRLGHLEPRWNAHPNCRWCQSFIDSQGQDPPPKLLDAHHRGIRITDTMVTDALRPGKPERRRRTKQPAR